MTLFGQYQVVARQDRKKGNHGGIIFLPKNSSALNCNAFSLAPQIDFCGAITLNVTDRTVVFNLVHLPPRIVAFKLARTRLDQYFRQFSNHFCD